VPEERPAAHETGSFKLWCRFLLALGWLLFVVVVSFVRGTPKPRRPDGEPEMWKVGLWLAIVFVFFLGLATSATYAYPYGTAPGSAR
jgi:hypothetical protein